MVAVFDDSDIDIYDVTVFEFFIAGNAMTNLMVGGGANGFRKATVVQGRRYRVLFIDDVVVADFVQLVGGDARFDVRLDHLEDIGGQSCRRRAFFRFQRVF